MVLFNEMYASELIGDPVVDKLQENVGHVKDVIVNIGRFGPYALTDGKFYSLKKGVDDPYTITLERAIEIIIEKMSQNAAAALREFSEDVDLKILKGRYGAYIKYKTNNIRIPSKLDWNTFTYEECMAIIKEGLEKKKKK